MSAERAAAVRTQYPARPGRRVIVVTDLAGLRGPTRGTVELPLRLYWSGPSPVFDLGEPYLRRWLYQIVLREASRPEDLTGYLDQDTLIALWPDLRLPKGVRQAWEEHHPPLQPSAVSRSGPGTDDPHPAGGRQHQRGQEPAAQAAWEDPEAEP